MESDPQRAINFLFEHWEVIFLYVFKYLADIKELLHTLHKDNAVQDTEIKHLKKEITDLKDWIKSVEDKI